MYESAMYSTHARDGANLEGVGVARVERGRARSVGRCRVEPARRLRRRVRQPLALRRDLAAQHGWLTPLRIQLLGAHEQRVRDGELTTHQRVASCQLERIRIFSQPLRAKDERPRPGVGRAFTKVSKAYCGSQLLAEQRVCF